MARYTPFDTALDDVSVKDLAVLRDVREGWYVDYKRDLISTTKIAKAISAFANHYGGWLFFGVEEDPNTNMAAAFPGLPPAVLQQTIEALRNASKDLLRPHVDYVTKVIEGPDADIQLAAGNAILIVEIPIGADPPYIHNDGRVYRRIADSADPKPETDRSVLDRLWERGAKARAQLADLVTRAPLTSKEEEHTCFVHYTITSDPYGTRDDWYAHGFEEFASVMSSAPIPFNNVYSRSTGFVARQTEHNDPMIRLFTWEFELNCTSFITVPVNMSRGAHELLLNGYVHADSFLAMLNEDSQRHARVIDLNLFLNVVTGIIQRHRELVAVAGIAGPFFVKAHIENAWRTIPFLDISAFVDHCREFGIPVVQDEDALAPPGTDLDTFVLLPERDAQTAGSGDSREDAIRVLIPVLEALGVPRETLAVGAGELLEAGARASDLQLMQRERSQS